MPRGGWRGGGRPKGSESEETKIRRALKQRWLDRVNEKADEFFDAHEKLALGDYYYEKMMPTGEVRIYRAKPSGEALRWMMEHIWGMAPLKLDLDLKAEITQTISIEAREQIKRAIAYALPKSRYTVIAPGGQDAALIAGTDSVRPDVSEGAGV